MGVWGGGVVNNNYLTEYFAHLKGDGFYLPSS